MIGVDVEIRPHNREAPQSHPLYHRISLIEGDSIAEETVPHVRLLVGEGETVMVVLDGNHSKAHVSRERERITYWPSAFVGRKP